MDEVVSGSERGWASGYINWWRYITSLVEAEPQQADAARMNSFLALMFLTILRADSSLARIVHLGKNMKCVSLCLFSIIAHQPRMRTRTTSPAGSRGSSVRRRRARSGGWRPPSCWCSPAWASSPTSWSSSSSSPPGHKQSQRPRLNVFNNLNLTRKLRLRKVLRINLLYSNKNLFKENYQKCI